MTEFVKANVVTGVRHNGTIYRAGEVIDDLTPAELQALIKVKAAAPADATPPVKSKISNSGDVMQPAQFAGSLPPNSQAASADATSNNDTHKTSDDDKVDAGTEGNPSAPASAVAGVKPEPTGESESGRAEHNISDVSNLTTATQLSQICQEQINLYSEKTNAGQLAYLQTLSDEDFKLQAEKLLLVSKSKSKAYIVRRMRSTDTGTVE